MSAFDDFTKQVLAGAKGLAVGAFKNLAGDLKSDAQDFVTKTEAKLKKWTTQLAKGELTQLEFEDLVKGRADVAKMKGITKAGLTAIQVNQLKDDLINLVINTAIKVFLPI